MIHGYRLTDNDHSFGPFTWGRSSGAIRFRVTFETGDDEYPGNCLMFWGFGRVCRVSLPTIMKPMRRWVPTGHQPWSESPNSGYWAVYEKRYGFCFGEAGHVQVFYGAQTDNDGGPVAEKRRGYFLPWTQWRLIREAFYDQDGKLFWEQTGFDGWQDWLNAKKSCPKVGFLVEDYDGARIKAKTHIQEHEWKLGEGWFRWVSLFRRSRIDRSLMIDFADEIGPEKGSWKGGLIGHSISMLPGETHQDAFRRYCEKEHNARGTRYRIRMVMGDDDA